MAASKTKITFGKPPASFKKSVAISTFDDEKVNVEFEFKYRTRIEFAQLKDQQEKRKLPTLTSYEDAINFRNEDEADLILSIANGWDLSDPFSKESLIDLFNKLPAAGEEIMFAYDQAINLGRIKN